MSDRIGKRVRAQAALICAMAASTGRGHGHGILEGLRWLRDDYLPLDMDGRDPVCDLARAAFDHTRAATETPDGWQRWILQMAEAEALLRTGWSP